MQYFFQITKDVNIPIQREQKLIQTSGKAQASKTKLSIGKPNCAIEAKYFNNVDTNRFNQIKYVRTIHFRLLRRRQLLWKWKLVRLAKQLILK